MWNLLRKLFCLLALLTFQWCTSTNVYKGMGGFFLIFFKICGIGTYYSILIIESMTYHEENTTGCFLLLRSFLPLDGAYHFQLKSIYYTWFFLASLGGNCPLSPLGSVLFMCSLIYIYIYIFLLTCVVWYYFLKICKNII